MRGSFWPNIGRAPSVAKQNSMSRLSFRPIMNRHCGGQKAEPEQAVRRSKLGNHPGRRQVEGRQEAGKGRNDRLDGDGGRNLAIPR